MRPLTASAVAVLLAATGPTVAAPCCDPASPFRAGEAMPETPATCETLQGWIDRRPDPGGRVSMAVRGAIETVDQDEALAYLILCPASGAQVMCVTYETLNMKPGDTVTVAGGVVPAGESRMMLDPCLAYPPTNP